QGNMAIVLVEQYFDFAYDLADHFHVLRRGAVILEGDRARIDRDTLLRNVSV
ncbi:MAG: ABC transporter ATP-binding protein, partial [Rhodobacteraceae bacterium]|nr:ABC transporter ATP-binding protein [Paracoccaceae bacterium]